MTSLLLAVRAPAASLERQATWAQSRVRIAASPSPKWTLLDVGSDDQAALERLAEQVTSSAPGLLLVVGEWRSAVHLWVQGTRRASVSWSAGEPNGLDAGAATEAARELGGALGLEPPSLIPLLRSMATADQGWRALTHALGMPIPADFPRLGSGSLDSAQARVLERRGLLDLIVEDDSQELRSAPDRTPQSSWKFAGRFVLLVVFVIALVWALAQSPPRVFPAAGMLLCIVVAAIDIAHQVSLRRAARDAA